MNAPGAARRSEGRVLGRQKRMRQVIRRPGGGWERNADGSKGPKLWQTRHGRRVLTRYGQDNLQDWFDLTIHVPCFEQELENPHHAHNDVPRQTWYPVSEQSLPGLTAALGRLAVPFDPTTAVVLPQVIKDFIRNRLNSFIDSSGHEILDVGSDREWYYDPTREWRMSVQHVQGVGAGARLRTDLDRPMRGQTF